MFSRTRPGRYGAAARQEHHRVGEELVRALRRPASWAWVMAVVISALAAGILLVGPWSVSRADAKTVTATCADARTDAATLNSAISSSKPGSQIVISGHCLLTGTVTLLGDRSYM